MKRRTVVLAIAAFAAARASHVSEPVESAIAAPAQAKAVKPAPKSTPLGELTTEQAIALIDKWAAGPVEETVFARVIGSAEGTRDRDGGKTDIYAGHVDPGNGVWNRGSFSYQFGNGEDLSPEEASRRQLGKILGHLNNTVIPQAKQYGIKLTPWELLNAADVANQAPLCITEEGGFVERLVEARKKAKEKKWDEYQTVLWARIEAYWDPSKGVYDASGLRAYDDVSKRKSIWHDQNRRMGEMQEALKKQNLMTVNGGDDVANVSYTPRSPGAPTNKVPGSSRGDRIAVF